MPQPDPQKGNWTFEEDKERLKVLKSNIEGARAAVRDTKKALEVEIEPYRLRLQELELEEKEVRERLTIQALGNFAASGNKTFGGITLKETSELLIHDPEMLIEQLYAEEVNGNPVVIVTYSLDKKALLEWAKAKTSLGIALPEGLELIKNYNMAVAATKD